MCNKNICKVILFLLLFTCLSCGKEEVRNTSIKILVKHVFAPFVTNTGPSSPIDWPGSASSEIKIINSQQEFINNIPSEVIKEDSCIRNINYNSNSLISIKYLSNYKPDKIEYKISKNEENDISIMQNIYVTEPLYVYGYYIMSNVVTEKLDTYNKITMMQSYRFNETAETE